MVLSDDNRLAQPLWIDEPGALERLGDLLSSGVVTEDEAAIVQRFIERGYLVVDLPGVSEDVDGTLSDVEQLWREPPSNLLAAGPVREGRPFPMSEIASQIVRGPGVRVLDIHSHSDAARRLYLNSTLHRLVGIIFGQPPVATQTIFFEYGSTQSLHRDPWYVNHTPRTHLLAAWIALEDISPDSGPLTLSPGSHRLPFYRFGTDDIVFHDPRVTTQEKWAAIDQLDEQVKPLGIIPFLGKRGQALIWHGSLAHGGSSVEDPAMTRKSLVVHFGCAATHPRRGASFDGQVRYTEDKYFAPNGESGFRNPVAEALVEAK